MNQKTDLATDELRIYSFIVSCHPSPIRTTGAFLRRLIPMSYWFAAPYTLV